MKRSSADDAALDSPYRRLQGSGLKAKCEVCANDYDKSRTVKMGGKAHTFDASRVPYTPCAGLRACACHDRRPRRESSGTFYCCANCASMSGVSGLEDRV